MPEDKIFLDTNVIIYAYDVSAGEKNKKATNILIDLWNSGLGVISTQVLQEFFFTITKKIPKPLDIKSAKKIVNDFLKWNLVVNDGESILDAIEIQLRYKYSFWDSLIIESAVKGRASFLFSEDLSDGQQIDGITIKNPFR